MTATATIDSIRDPTREEYQRICRLVYEHSGINLGDHKTQLVRARMSKLLREEGLSSYHAYCDRLEADSTGTRLCELLDAISTNTTHLFREKRHFGLLHAAVRDWATNHPKGSGHGTLRIWSAACSSGEEPHSIAMTVHDALISQPGLDVKILATDISTRMLERARQGLYEFHRLGTVPDAYRKRYFRRVICEDGEHLQLIPELRNLITFARFNLMSPAFSFRHGFDIIFCRNVMIYFDRPTQEALVNKLATQLHPGGFLMVGHSESLNGVRHPLTYVEPSVYSKR